MKVMINDRTLERNRRESYCLHTKGAVLKLGEQFRLFLFPSLDSFFGTKLVSLPHHVSGMGLC